MQTEKTARPLSTRWWLGGLFYTALAWGFWFVISGGYQDAVDAKARHFVVDIASPIPADDLVASVSADDMRQIQCLAENMYFEAATQGQEGMKATGDVVFNRLASGLYPDSVCQIIDQGPRDAAGRLLPLRCQFTWRCDGTDTTIRDPRRWAMAYEMAYSEYLHHDKMPDLTGGATRYHAAYVHPKWPGWVETARIGLHVFLKPDPGRTK